MSETEGDLPDLVEAGPVVGELMMWFHADMETPGCSCGHEGLGPDWHLQDCLFPAIAYRRKAWELANRFDADRPVRALIEAREYVADGFPLVSSHVQDRVDVAQASVNELRPPRAAKVSDGFEDPRLAILDEAIGYALDNDGERTPGARMLLNRLDEVSRDSAKRRRLYTLYEVAEEFDVELDGDD